MNNPTNTAEPLPAAPCSAPDWKAIAYRLLHQCDFALVRLKANGWTGILISDDGSVFHETYWKDAMADEMERIPGVKVDRETMRAFDLPPKARAKFFAARKASKAQNSTDQKQK